MKKTIDEGLKALQTLDLSQAKRKLKCPAPEGQGWSYDQRNFAKKWYIRFLELHVRFPGQRFVPNHIIDTMWHQHIVDTRAYASDCEAIFGEFLHHDPYFGMMGDAADRDAAFEKTNQLYVQLFGEDCRNMGPFASVEVDRVSDRAEQTNAAAQHALSDGASCG